MILINKFEANDNLKKIAETSDEITQFDDFSELLAAFLFTPEQAKPPLRTDQQAELSVENDEFQTGSETIGESLPVVAKAEMLPNQLFAPDPDPIPFKKPPRSTTIIEIPTHVFENKTKKNLFEDSSVLKNPPPAGLAENTDPEISLKSEVLVNGNSPGDNSTQPTVSEKPDVSDPIFDRPKFDEKASQVSRDQPRSEFEINKSRVEVVSSKEMNEIEVWQPFELALPKPITKTDFAANLSQLFQGVSKVMKFENGEKVLDQNTAKSAPNFSFDSEENIAEHMTIKPIEASGLNNATDDLGQFESKIVQSAASPDSAENITAKMFDNLLSNAAKGTKPAEISQAIANGEKVFEQIEAHLARETMIFAPNTNKPNILKLRLRPAELGTVEIRLEKDASGKLTAHFQTETEATRQILVERFEGLQNALQNSGWQIDKLDITCKSFSSAGNENRDDQSRESEPLENRLGKTDGFEVVLDKRDESSTKRLVSLRA